MTGELLQDEYEIIGELGVGAQGRSLLVREPGAGRQCVAKELWLGPVDDLKTVELFERSAEVLRCVDHGGIPDYVDHIIGEPGEHDAPQMLLIREFVPGDSLLDKLDEGWRPSEEELLDLAEDILRVFRYLHEHKPPIVHRDVKPANIIRHLDDGRYRLVDFGTVQAKILDTVGGSTMTGTAGYVPFEQLAGRAVPQSDLYALGMTLIHLASHTHPSELPEEDYRIDFRDYVDLSGRFEELLWELTAPMPEDRVASADKALDRIDECREKPSESTGDAEIESTRTRENLSERSEHELLSTLGRWVRGIRTFGLTTICCAPFFFTIGFLDSMGPMASFAQTMARADMVIQFSLLILGAGVALTIVGHLLYVLVESS